MLEKPVMPSFSVLVKDMSNNRAVYQNTVELHLTCWQVKPLASSWILPWVSWHKTPETLPEREYEGRFFQWWKKWYKWELSTVLIQIFYHVLRGGHHWYPRFM